MAAARLGRLLPGSSVLFLCDLQERFRGSIVAFPQIVAVAARMLQGCRILGVPVLVTEQRPEVLGPTVPELGAQDLPRVPKTAFSMVGAAGPLLEDPKIRSVLLCGIEAQACILPGGAHPCPRPPAPGRGLPEHLREPPAAAAARRRPPPLQTDPATDQGAPTGHGADPRGAPGGAGGALRPLRSPRVTEKYPEINP
ncbi:isochorismatase domain-containing protein 2 isoform X2 [Aphelocoma coerulescens]|uniref:isochorismatase domain-containing protein 2 isoform X2 n=1 Tax=Aphelocoma coerulescens TaxID=39617 RepID=UPI0036050B88